MNITIDAKSAGERIVMAVAVITLCAEMLSNNPCSISPQPVPVTLDACSALCVGQGDRVKRVEGWACECEPTQ